MRYHEIKHLGLAQIKKSLLIKLISSCGNAFALLRFQNSSITIIFKCLSVRTDIVSMMVVSLKR
jgi:hypothetical protein